MRNVLHLFIILLLTGSASAQPATMTWPDTIAPLTGQRGQAVACVALLKRDGNPTQISDTQPKYARAKAESDALIAGLLTALAGRDTPASLSSLQDRLAKSYAELADFCNSVNEIVVATRPPGERDVWSALAKMAGIENLVNKLSEAVAALYNNYRTDNALTRKIIQNQLETARWPDFAAVERAP